jgi:hypothetical protein
MAADTTFQPLASLGEDKAEDITFAVEIKSILPLKLSDTSFSKVEMRPFVPHRPKTSLDSMTDSEKQVQRDTHKMIAAALCSVPGMKSTTYDQILEDKLERSDYWKTHWIVYKANSAVPEFVSYEEDDEERPLMDATAPGYNGFVWVPVELCSPKLWWIGMKAAVADIVSVCRTLQQNFNAVANHSTEVHVHIGRHDGLFYSLRNMKKLATVLWLSEPILRSLRDPKSRNFTHTFTWGSPWREQSRIALALQRRLPDGRTIDDLATGHEDEFDIFLAGGGGTGDQDKEKPPGPTGEDRQALRAIWRAATHTELGSMLCGIETNTRRLGFNFHALAGETERARASPRTIEFRFLEGCIDDGVVVGWVQVCVALAKVATDPAEEGRFYDLVALLLTMLAAWGLDAKFVAMMQELGVARDAYEPLLAIVRRNYPPSGEAAEAGGA